MVGAMLSCTTRLGRVLGSATHSWLSQWYAPASVAVAFSDHTGFEYLFGTTCVRAASVLGFDQAVVIVISPKQVQ